MNITFLTVITLTSVFIAVYFLLSSAISAIGANSRISRAVTGKADPDSVNSGLPLRAVSDILFKLVTSASNIMRFESSSGAGETKRKLYQAGFRGENDLAIFMSIKYLGTILIFVLLVGGKFFKSGEFSFTGQFSIIVCTITIVYFLGTEFVVSKIIDTRHRTVSESLPDCLDLLVVCTEAGLSLDAALQRVASEMSNQSRVMSEELRTTVLELGFLPERRHALENLASRIVDDSVQNLVNTLVQSERYGTPLANSLRVISNEIRDKRVMRAEEKAARLPAILTVPMIVFILPTLFIVLAGPAFIEVYDNMK